MGSKKKVVWTAFECPICSADNPMDDGFSPGDDVFCSYCGSRFRVRVEGDVEDQRYRLVTD